MTRRIIPVHYIGVDYRCGGHTLTLSSYLDNVLSMSIIQVKCVNICTRDKS